MKKLLGFAFVASLVLSGCMPTPTLAGYGLAEKTKPTRSAYDAKIIDKDIAFWKGKTHIDPQGAIGWSQLAGAYLKRSKESDSMEAARLAEAAARKSLSIRRIGNVGAANKVTSALLEQHRFREALASAEDALAIRSDDSFAIQQKLSVLIELGRYDEAQALFKANPQAMTGPSGLFAQARMYQLKGEQARAEDLLRQACDEVDYSAGIARESVAWFHTKLAAQLYDSANLAEAEKEYRIALDLYPRNYKAMIGMQHIAAEKRDWKAVIDWGHQTETLVSMPESLALMGDAFSQIKDRKMAQEHYDEALNAAGLHAKNGTAHHHHGKENVPHGHPLDRQLTVILAEHGWNPKEAVAAAKRDLIERPDAEAKINLAYALAKEGNLQEAKKIVRAIPKVHVSRKADAKLKEIQTRLDGN